MNTETETPGSLRALADAMDEKKFNFVNTPRYNTMERRATELRARADELEREDATWPSGQPLYPPAQPRDQSDATAGKPTALCPACRGTKLGPVGQIGCPVCCPPTPDKQLLDEAAAIYASTGLTPRQFAEEIDRAEGQRDKARAESVQRAEDNARLKEDLAIARAAIEFETREKIANSNVLSDQVAALTKELAASREEARTSFAGGRKLAQAQWRAKVADAESRIAALTKERDDALSETLKITDSNSAFRAISAARAALERSGGT